MSSIPQRLYNEVMMLDNFICVYCGKRTPEVGIDHIIPRHYGGPDTLHNLVACCPRCNSRKSDQQLHEVGMRLQFGRFTRPTRSGARKVVALPPTPQAPMNARPRLSREDRTTRILELAHEKDEHGKYAFSANAISKMVGGTNADNMALIASVRPKPPAPTTPPPARAERPAGGWQQKESIR